MAEQIRSRVAAARGLGAQLMISRWFMVFGCLLIMSMSGATYIFGIYSNDIKTALGYDQSTLNLISFFKDLGGNIGIMSGVINEVTPPWVVLAIGMSMNFSGYFMIWLAVTGRVARPKIWQICLYICVGANSQTFSNTGALVTCVKNFPQSRGIVIGLLKGFTGLSGAIITQLFHAFYAGDSKALILLIAWLPAAVSFVFLPTVRLMKSGKEENEVRIFYHLLYISLALAGFLMTAIVLENWLTFSQPAYAASASVVLVLLFAPLCVVVREELKKKNDETVTTEAVEPAKEMSVLPVRPPLQRGLIEEFEKNNDNTVSPAKEMSVLPVRPPPQRGLIDEFETDNGKTVSAEAVESEKQILVRPPPQRGLIDEFEKNNGKTVSAEAVQPEKQMPVRPPPQRGLIEEFEKYNDKTVSAEAVEPEKQMPVRLHPQRGLIEEFEKDNDKTVSAEAVELEPEKQMSVRLPPTPWWKDVLKPPERGEDYNILQAVFSIDMIILFTAITFGVGGTLTAIDNLGQIGRALGYPAKSITTFVSLVSIWNYLGRVTAGFASEIFLAKYKFPRPLMLTLVLLVSCTGHLLIAFGVPNSLYVASVIMGFCFGAQWPLIFAIISEIFGLKYYSTLFNLGGGASPLGAYILNVRITGHLYDAEATRQMAAKGLRRREGEDLSCSGVDCYKVAFLIITATTMVGCIVSSVLVVRTRKFYRGDIYKKFREQEV